MTTQLKAIERVCDKRHARLIIMGKAEKESSEIICSFLKGWIDRQKHDKAKFFGRYLLSGYEAML
jgi:hypothetical protein